MNYPFKGFIYGNADLVGDPAYITLVDFPIPVFLESDSVFILRNVLAISKEFYRLPDFEDSQELFEAWCSTPTGKKTLVADMIEFAEFFGSTDLAKSLAKDQRFVHFGV